MQYHNDRVEERHPLKQGLKHSENDISLPQHKVEERHPLKQGLKLSTSTGGATVTPSCWRKTSTKTRIETRNWLYRRFRSICWRKTSTKTRIETRSWNVLCEQEHAVEERHPLKQGLKRLYRQWRLSLMVVEERHPLKQGLKQLFESFDSLFQQSWRKTSTKTRIETSNYLEWGSLHIPVEERHPLKQGLKH